MGISATLAVGAWILAAPELAFLAVSSGVAWMLAAVSLLARPDVVASVLVEPKRVERGGMAHARVTVTARRRTRGFTVVLPRIGWHRRVRLGTQETVIFEDIPVRTTRRGPMPIGPVLITRSDSFGMFTWEQSAGEPTELLVTPRIWGVTARTAASTSRPDGSNPRNAGRIEGGLLFDSVREYQPGDDLRRIHWSSTLRAVEPGTLYVRRFLEVPAPVTCVVLDLRGDVYGPDPAQFEEMVDAAASLCLASIADGHRLHVTAAATGTARLGLSELGGFEPDHCDLRAASVLDYLTRVRVDPAVDSMSRPSAGRDEDPLAEAVRRLPRRIAGQVTLVTGPLAPYPEQAAMLAARRAENVVLLRVGVGGTEPDGGGAVSGGSPEAALSPAIRMRRAGLPARVTAPDAQTAVSRWQRAVGARSHVARERYLAAGRTR